MRRHSLLSAAFRFLAAATLAFVSTLTLAEVKLQTLHSFSALPNGANPDSQLVEDSAGNLYGTALGGASGIVFKLSPEKNGTWTETVIHNFTAGSDGAGPAPSLVIDSKGNLYGTTYWGGAYDGGIVFKLSPTGNTWKETILHNFTIGYTDGNDPAGVVMDAAGNLYGVTIHGGDSDCEDVYEDSWLGCGIAYELSPGGANGAWTETILFNFGTDGDTSGGWPDSTLVFDQSGNIYGSAEPACYECSAGSLFQLSKSSTGVWSEATVANYEWPPSSLAIDAQANLYVPNPNSPNEVIQYVPASAGTWNMNTIYTFSEYTDVDSLIFDAAGNLYGTTGIAYGGAQGSIFELTPASSGNWTENTVYSFTGGSDGAAPNTPMFDSKGNIYVSAAAGGQTDCPLTYYSYDYTCGTIFELSPNSTGGYTGTTLYEFSPGPIDGNLPEAGLVEDSSGNLYGTTYIGGGWLLGAVYELSPGHNGSWTSSVLYSFSGTNGDGEYPLDNLVFDSSGNLYGTTEEGGTYGGGTVFELSPSSSSTWKETVLYSFDSKKPSTDAYRPETGLAFDSEGNLYGATGSGGEYGCGAVFRLVPSSTSWSESLIYNFTGCSEYGAYSASGVIFDSHGNLYGTADFGGADGAGFVYELTPSDSEKSWTETTLYSFTGGTNGSTPIGGLVLDAEGNLYGTTESGGLYTYWGEVFKLTPNLGTWTKTTIHSFTSVNGDGRYPQETLAIDDSGNLYGTTPFGGTNTCPNCGMVFELSPSGSGYRETILYDFNDDINGGVPYSSIILDSHGNLYGTTSQAGGGGEGTVFQITP
jgi:uncharacterized repeat protein (TIGR03803 family)